MSVIDVRSIKEKTVADLQKRVEKFKNKHGFSPSLAIVLAGDDKASESYVRTKRKMCALVGIETADYIFPGNVSESELVERIETLNADDKVNGILVQLPLPSHIDSFAVIEHILPAKDADGLTSANFGLLLKDRPAVIACTPKGIVRILDEKGIDVSGKTVVIMNRSQIVGRPLAAYLISSLKNATVISCNSKTENLRDIVSKADIVIAATGRAEMIDKSWKFKRGAVVIDVSISRVPDNSVPKGYRVCGDLKASDFKGRSISYTPVPGGVGLMTVMMLLENTVELAERQ